MIPFPNKKYKIIYADPPWQYDVSFRRSCVDKKYDLMSDKSIQNLPIDMIREESCILFCWVTMPKLIEGLDLIKAWGFNYKTCAFVWVKTSNYTNNQSNYLGMGYYTRQNSELCLLATYGDGCASWVNTKPAMRNIIYAPVRKHSQKPPIVREKIVKLMGDLPRIELFARTRIHGWDTWGNDSKLTELQPLESYLNEEQNFE